MFLLIIFVGRAKRKFSSYENDALQQAAVTASAARRSPFLMWERQGCPVA